MPTKPRASLNPAAVRARNGTLLLYPRMVAAGNCSCIGVVEVSGSPDAPVYQRLGLALRPEAAYEFRDRKDGHGCEDPRVTFVPALDAFVMAYTAFGAIGPRIALALSHDGYAWERLGLVDFSASGLPNGADKDGAFFPEPVRSPLGVPSFAMYHRPMTFLPPEEREIDPCPRDVMRIAYIPLEAALQDRANLLSVAESVVVSEGSGDWALIKDGAGTPPVRIGEGWLSIFHGVDRIVDEDGTSRGMRYSAGILVHDADQPHRIRYRSAAPILTPDALEEQHGIVNNVVFPTGIDVHTASPRTYDVYYGMADARIGRVHLELGESILGATA